MNDFIKIVFEMWNCMLMSTVTSTALSSVNITYID